MMHLPPTYQTEGAKVVLFYVIFNEKSEITEGV